MVKERVDFIIELEADSDLAKALATAEDRPVVVVSNGHRYAVRRDVTRPVNDQDDESFREALRAASGIFPPEEAEKLKQDIYRWREEGTRPITRP